MCEIAIIDPEEMDIEYTQQLAGIFFREQGDGLGVTAVHHNGEDADKPFEYDVYKSTEPHWQTVYTFLRRNYDAWRIIVHARAKTTGAVNRKTAHPIGVNCPSCEFDHVIHNGHVRSNSKKRERLADKGHWFETEVDTEVIAHEVSELPDSVEGFTRRTYNLRGNLHYILLSSDGMLVRSGQKYDMAEDLTMTCRFHDFEDAEDLGFERGKKNRWALITPGNDEPEIEIEQSAVRTTAGSNTVRTAYRGDPSANRKSGVPGAAGSWGEEEADEDDDTITVEYVDLSSYGFLSVVKVAPGVLKMFDHEKDEQGVIRRELYPRLYYFYVEEDEPENIDQLAELAENRRGRIPEGEDLSGAIAEFAATSVGNVADVDLDENTVQQAITDVQA